MIFCICVLLKICDFFSIKLVFYLVHFQVLCWDHCFTLQLVDNLNHFSNYICNAIVEDYQEKINEQKMALLLKLNSRCTSQYPFAYHFFEKYRLSSLVVVLSQCLLFYLKIKFKFKTTTQFFYQNF